MGRFMRVIAGIGLSLAIVGSVIAAEIITITSPANGSTISGTVTVTATSTVLSLNGVRFYVDNQWIGSVQGYASPYSISWNTKAVSNGSHTLMAEVGTYCVSSTGFPSVCMVRSAPVTVMVKNPGRRK